MAVVFETPVSAPILPQPTLPRPAPTLPASAQHFLKFCIIDFKAV